MNNNESALTIEQQDELYIERFKDMLYSHDVMFSSEQVIIAESVLIHVIDILRISRRNNSIKYSKSALDSRCKTSDEFIFSQSVNFLTSNAIYPILKLLFITQEYYLIMIFQNRVISDLMNKRNISEESAMKFIRKQEMKLKKSGNDLKINIK